MKSIVDCLSPIFHPMSKKGRAILWDSTRYFSNPRTTRH